MKQTFQEIVREQELEREKETRNKDKEIKQRMFEVMQRGKRRNNLIITGKMESSEVNEQEVKKILDTLMEEVNIKYDIIGRVVKKEIGGSKGRPLRIQLDDVDHKRRLLSRGKKLKDTGEGFKKVYLAPDLTKLQQEEDKKLKEFRNAGKLNVKIAKGEIVSFENVVTEVLFTLVG